MKNEMNKIVIIMEHGIIRNVISKDQAEVVVIHRDVPIEEAGEDTLEHYANNNVIPLFARQGA